MQLWIVICMYACSILVMCSVCAAVLSDASC
jgi:hypothetical protein